MRSGNRGATTHRGRVSMNAAVAPAGRPFAVSATISRARCAGWRYEVGVSVIAAISQRVPTRSGGPQKPVPWLT